MFHLSEASTEVATDYDIEEEDVLIDDSSDPDVELETVSESESESDEVNQHQVTEVKEKKSAYHRANIFLRIFLCWVDPLFFKGCCKSLEEDDIWALNPAERAGRCLNEFERSWQKQLKKKNPSLVIAFITMPLFWKRFCVAALLAFIWAVAYVASPGVILYELIHFISDPEAEEWIGWVLSVALFVDNIIALFAVHHYFVFVTRTGIRLRSAVIAALYSKSLKLKSLGRSVTVGEILNIVSNDCQRILDCCLFINFLWMSGVIALMIFGLLLYRTEWTSVPGIVLLICIAPIQTLLAKFSYKLRQRAIKITDERVRVMSEILNAVKLVKLYAWELPFSNKVSGIRGTEVKKLKSIAIIKCSTMFFSQTLTMVACYITFILYTEVKGEPLTADIAFTVVALFNGLRFPMTMLANSVKTLMESWIAFKRIKRILLLEETEEKPFEEIDEENDKYIIQVKNGTFKWESGLADNFDTQPTISNLNLKLKKGETVAVVGTVGAGKSSLLSALLNQIDVVSGSVSVKGSIAYCAQQAWIFNASLKENILFNTPYIEDKYIDTLASCALESDLNQLSNGQYTEIGERGINLSGGQKQRVSIARAVYSDSDVYLFDDPLSAVDQHVGKYLFHNCINGALKDKTVVLVTHQLQYLPFVDQVVFLKDGCVAGQGTFDYLMNTSEEFAGLVRQQTSDHDHNDNIEDLPSDDNSSTDLSKGNTSSISEELTEAVLQSKKNLYNIVHASDKERFEKLSQQKLEKKKNLSLLYQITHPMKYYRNKKRLQQEAQNKSAVKGSLTVAEDRQTGGIPFWVFVSFGKACGGILVVLPVFILFAFSQALSVFIDYWVSAWSGDKYDLNNEQYIYWYAVMLGVFVFLFAVRTIVYPYMMLTGSSRLHNKCFQVVLNAPMLFFDQTPIGRILNRFSKDMDGLDDMLPDNSYQFIYYFFFCISSIILICVFVPIFTAVVVPIGVVFLILTFIYRKTGRELKRIMAITTSPLFSNFTGTLQGLNTITAYKRQDLFRMKNEKLIDRHHESLFTLFVAQRWLGMRLDVLSSCVALATALFAVSSRDDPETAGLALTYAIQVAGIFQYTVRLFVETETYLTSVERIAYYNRELKSEEDRIPEDHKIKPKQISESWPSEGKITFKDVTCRFRDDLDDVLKGVTFSIKGKEKIGIVGRTGAGKSTLTLLLFRILESHQGTVKIDNLDISTLPLHILRPKLSIIPQDPVLFTGSMRQNLDPFFQYSDQEVWSVLEKVSLTETINRLPEKLDEKVLENGENFSVGQRQLICIARALLRESNILVLDEATASVDIETDVLIQRTIRKEFKDRTVITIAHRLNTIIDSDKILVLDKGLLKEFDTPLNLLNDPYGLFYSLTQQMGPGEFQKLKSIASGEVDLFDVFGKEDQDDVNDNDKGKTKRKGKEKDDGRGRSRKNGKDRKTGSRSRSRSSDRKGRSKIKRDQSRGEMKRDQSRGEMKREKGKSRSRSRSSDRNSRSTIKRDQSRGDVKREEGRSRSRSRSKSRERDRNSRIEKKDKKEKYERI